MAGLPLMSKPKDETPGLSMDTSNGRETVPGVPDRLSGADRSGLGEKGWAEVPDDLVGRPDDTNITPDLHQPTRDEERVADRKV